MKSMIIYAMMTGNAIYKMITSLYVSPKHEHKFLQIIIPNPIINIK